MSLGHMHSPAALVKIAWKGFEASKIVDLRYHYPYVLRT